MDLFHTIEKFQKSMKEYLSRFSIKNDNDPISFEKIQQIQLFLSHWSEDLLPFFNECQKEDRDFTKKNQNSTKIYRQQLDTLKKNYSKNIKEATLFKEQISKNLKKDISSATKQTNDAIKQLKLDAHYFKKTSEQKELVLKKEFDAKKEKLDYQKEEAKLSYLAIVQKYNHLLDRKKAELEEEFTSQKKSYEQDYSSLIRQLELKIESSENELNSLLSLLENERNNIKEKYRQESVLLNNNIKKIAEERNLIIDQAKSEYSKAQSNANIEKENQKQSYQAKSQILLKEFVTKINEIDESLNKFKKEYDDKVDQIKRKYYFSVFQITDDFHKELEKVYQKYHFVKQSYDKYTLRLIKYKDKQFQMALNDLKQNTEAELKNITKNYTKSFEEGKNNKSYLEIDKNYALKNIADQEQFDNKYYQEKNSIFENENNYIISTANYQFSQKANLLRCQSQIRTKLLERNFDSIETNYYKKIETIQNKINNYKLEIALANETHEAVVNYQEKKYLDSLHLEEVLNLLEIEKNKLLKEYNESSYKHNIAFWEEKLSTDIKKIELDNERFEKLKELKTDYYKKLLNKNSATAIYSMKKEELNEQYIRQKETINFEKNTELAKEDYCQSLFENDAEFLQDIYGGYHKYLRNVSHLFQKFIDMILKDVNVNEKNIHYFRSFLSSVFEIFITLYQDSLQSITDRVLKIINDRLKFIEEFKYQERYNDLKEKYDADQFVVKEKSNQLLDQIDSYTKTVDNFKQKIFTIVNDNAMLSENKNFKKLKQDEKKYTIYKENELKIAEYREKMENFTKIIQMNQEDLDDCTKKIQKNHFAYENELRGIQKLQYEDSKTYLHYKKVISSFKEHYEEKAKELFRSVLPETIEKKPDIFVLRGIQKKFEHLLNKTDVLYQYDLTNFGKKLHEDRKIQRLELESRYSRILTDYQEDEDKIFERHRNEKSNALKEINADIAHQEQILKKTENDFVFKEKLLEQQHQDRANHLMQMYEEITNQFFLSHEALMDNHKIICKYHQRIEFQDEIRFKMQKNKSIEKNLEEKRQLNEKLSGFIKTKNEEIEHLPIAYKYNTHLLNNETKKKNADLHTSIRQAKIKFNSEHKNIQHRMVLLQVQLRQSKLTNDLNQEKNLKTEKRDDRIHLKKSLKNIKIAL